MRYQTRAVLAGAYRSTARASLTHTYDEVTQRVLCKRVKVENLADVHADNPRAMPTCLACAKRDPRIWVEVSIGGGIATILISE